MSAEENKVWMLKWIEAVKSPDWEQATKPFFQGAMGEWRDWFVENHRAFLKAFPDFDSSILHVAADDDTVIVITKVTGTHTAEFPSGELKGVAPTGKKLEWQEAQWAVFDQGNWVDGGLLVDGVSRLQQLGVLPSE